MVGRHEEVSGEGNLVSDLRLGGVYPGIRHVRQDLPPEERFDAAFFEQRHLLGVAQAGIRLVFHHRGSAVALTFVEAIKRVRRGLSGLADLPDDRRGGLVGRRELGL